MPQMTAYFLPQRQKGGVTRFRLKVWQRHIHLSDSFHCRYKLLLGPRRAEREKKAGTIATPPKKWGTCDLG